MKILVTGGTGNVGRAAVARLVRHGHEVKVIGRRANISIEGAEYQSCDITDFAALREQMKGLEAVVHLAAIPSPAGGPGQEIFRVNCMGSFNVYRAAADEGIRRVVSASSINALGYNYGIKEFELLYFPIDEDHPGFTTDPYSFSKQILEETAAYFWRREGISGVCLRLPGVYELTENRRHRMAEFISKARERYEELIALPETERQAIVEQTLSTIKSLREERAKEQPRTRQRADRSRRPALYGITNFWANVNAEDSAQAMEKALLAEYEGSYPLYINDSHNSVDIESETLASIFFPSVKGRKRPLEGTESLVSIDKARELIGFEPEHSVSQWFKIAG